MTCHLQVLRYLTVVSGKFLLVKTVNPFDPEEYVRKEADDKITRRMPTMAKGGDEPSMQQSHPSSNRKSSYHGDDITSLPRFQTFPAVVVFVGSLPVLQCAFLYALLVLLSMYDRQVPLRDAFVGCTQRQRQRQKR
jgi:hypothetical protein